MNTEISPEMTIGQIVAQHFRAADVFARRDIDFCCGGKKTLERACQEHHVLFTDLAQELQMAINTPTMPSQDANTWSLDHLVDHIEQTHHRYVRENVPLLFAYTEKIAEVHGERHPELHILAKQFRLLGADLLDHLLKEEKILFPYVRDLATHGEGRLPSAEGPIHVMEYEHEYAGSLLDNIRGITNNFQLPADACTTYEVTFRKLQEFEQDLHWHIHLENNVLFPKVLQAESNRKN